MRRSAKLLVGLGLVGTLYVAILLVGGRVAASRVAERIRARIADSLAGETTIGGASVDLWTGQIAIADVEMRRPVADDLAFSVRELDVEIARFGAAIFDRAPRRVRIRGGRMIVHGADALRLPPRRRRPPVRVGAVELDDVALEMAATGFWPELAKLTVTVDRARSGPTTMRSGLSWLLTLEALVARVELPMGASIRLEVRDGTLTAAGAFLGSEPIAIPWPVSVDDGVEEAQALARLGKELAKRLAIERAKGVAAGWIEQALRP